MRLTVAGVGFARTDGGDQIPDTVLEKERGWCVITTG